MSSTYQLHKYILIIAESAKSMLIINFPVPSLIETKQKLYGKPGGQINCQLAITAMPKWKPLVYVLLLNALV